MTDQEIMLSLSNMLEPIKSDISEMKNDISQINARLKRVELTQENAILPRLQKVESTQEKEILPKLQKVELTQEKEILPRMKRVELTQENAILPRLQTIESCYISTYDRYRQSVDGYDELRQDMDVVKRTVAEHSAKLQMIPILRRKKVKI